MPLTITWEQIALRLLLASVAAFLIGLNRDEQGHPAGIRTTMLVCLAAALAMVQVNLMLPVGGKTASSFAVMDLMRLPLGILTGVGFIGAGVIFKKSDQLVSGVTTAATLWFVTVLGLLFGGGQLWTGTAGTLLAIFILWILKRAEGMLKRERHGNLVLELSKDAPDEHALRARLRESGFGISRWTVDMREPAGPVRLDCEVTWHERASHMPDTPRSIEALSELPGVRRVRWSA